MDEKAVHLMGSKKVERIKEIVETCMDIANQDAPAGCYTAAFYAGGLASIRVRLREILELVKGYNGEG